ncbi:MAG: type II methionyl aminopeptidase [Candidatus Heimdallarchaeota archaeon]
MSKEKKKPASKSTAKKTTAKSTTKKKPTAAKTSTAKGTAAKKPAAKKTTTKTTAKKTSTSKTTKKPTTTKKAPAKKPASATKKKTTTKTVTKPTTTTKKKVVKKKVEKSEESGPLDKYLQAGEISIKVKELLRKKVKVGVTALELCELGEAKIVELGGKWAFPLNVSINNVAAHYSSPPEDTLVIRTGDIVKIDVGVHVDGYVADTAFTVSFGQDHGDLIKASEEATKAAIDLIRPGITTDRIGDEIESIIRSYDFRPIKELSGHQLDQNLLHGPLTIPNISGTKGIKLEDGQAFAIETFATSGSGSIHSDESRCFIYQLYPMQIPLRLDSSKRARKVILANYREFPFTIRWIAKELTAPTARLALKDLANKGQVKKHSVLSDIRGSFVSQSEHTVYLTGNSRVVTTLPKQ